ncbi:MFS transporter [Actinomadura opuntiae]|uniref:MFS transporter n=1 Tax=Actinomadura sp. OS1-43 TaxID=604315 RepID=UPI00255AACF1|nr:MFS transporter [Actinomadura sp. OS1-43]MDL4813275.1 MFS transporter [Actinomadura sp. OS1-43]
MHLTTSGPLSRGVAARRALLPLTACFAALEGYDLACYGVTVPSLLGRAGIGADKSSAGTVGSMVAVGMLAGATLAAVLVRRLGSRRLILGGAALFSAGMLICALAPTFTIFGIARLIVGAGLGVVLPTVTAYVADVSAPGHGSRNVGIMMAGYPAGALLAPLLGTALLPDASWRWIYLGGAVPVLALLPLSARLLPESPVAPARDSGEPGKAGDLFGLGPLLARGVRMATLLFWVISFCGLLLVFGISTWLPSIMVAGGYSLGSSLLQTAAMWAGAGVGMVAGGRAADRIGTKPVVVIAFLTGAAGLAGLSARPPLWALFALMFVSGLGFIGSQALVNALIVTRYPLALRGTGIGWALSAGRFGAILGPTAGGWILSSGLSIEWNFYLFAVPGLLGAALAAVVPALRTGGAVAGGPGCPADRDPGLDGRTATP